MKLSSAVTMVSCLVSLAAGCTSPIGMTSSPETMQATPDAVSVEVGKTTDVAIVFKDGNNRVLSTATWLPLCSISSSSSGVATAAIVGNQVRVFGDAPGTATITVTSSASVKTTITVQVTEPVPVITVNSFHVVKGLEYELIVDGSGILPGAKVQVNGQVYTPTVLSPTRLRVFFSRDVTYQMTGSLDVAVFNPPNGALSNVVSVAVQNASPDIEFLSITSAPQGSPQVELDIRLETTFGWAAYSTSKVRWNGTDLTTILISPTTLRAVIPAALLTTAGTYDITVFNPTPGGGTSGPEPFVVTSSAGTARFDFSNYEPQVAWAAAAQGSGAFAQVPVVNKVVQFPVSSGTASLAFVSSVGTAFRSLLAHPETAGVITYQVTVITMTSAELTAGVIPMGLPFGTTALSGTVTGVGAGQAGLLQWGNATAGVTPGSLSFSMTNAAAGSHALVGYRKGASISASDRVFARPNQGSGSGITVDFNGAESAPVATATASLSGLIAGDQAFGQMGYTTESTCEGSFLYTTPASASFLITGMPGALQGANDRHLFTFLILNGSTVLSHTINSKAFSGFAATRPALLAAPTVTDIAGAPYQIKQAQVNLGSYNSAVLFYSNMSVTATRNALGGAAGTLRAPDLSGVAGWSAAWAPAPTSNWTVAATTTIYPLPGCADGSTRTTVSVSGSNP